MTRITGMIWFLALLFCGLIVVGCNSPDNHASDSSPQREANKQQLQDIQNSPSSFSTTPTQPIATP